jgi:E3 ubiquitin-protein ligase DOA10
LLRKQAILISSSRGQIAPYHWNASIRNVFHAFRMTSTISGQQYLQRRGLRPDQAKQFIKFACIGIKPFACRYRDAEQRPAIGKRRANIFSQNVGLNDAQQNCGGALFAGIFVVVALVRRPE